MGKRVKEVKVPVKVPVKIPVKVPVKIPVKVPITEKSISIPGTTELDIIKIKNLLLDKHPTIREDVCRVLSEGLKAMKPVVCDGQVFSEVDSPTRLKYAEIIAKILEGDMLEGASGKAGEYHLHFTNVLQHIRQHERVGALRVARPGEGDGV